MESISKLDNSVLDNLKRRFANGLYHTLAADVLLSLQPNYSSERTSLIEQIHGNDVDKSLLYSFAKNIFDALLLETDEELWQRCILLRGNSGSGKTETCKDLINFWSQSYSQDEILKLKINQAFIVLEAFGNAATPTNRNASRSATTFTLHIQSNQIVGASVSQLLLDPWRVVGQPKGDGNFHAFYYAIAGQHGPQDKIFYRILKNQSRLSREALREYELKQRSMLEAMKVLGFSAQEQSDTLLLLMMLLSLSNVTFRRSKNGDAMISDESKHILRSFSEILGLDDDELEECLCWKTVSVHGSESNKPYTRDETEDFLDFLIWTIYVRLYSWIVNHINSSLSIDPKCGASKGSKDVPRQISVVDFPGFEVLQSNSFEQLLINVADEILHFMFVENYSTLSEKDFAEDEQDWSPSKLNDNSSLVCTVMASDGLLDTISKIFKEGKASPCLPFDQWEQSIDVIRRDSNNPDLFSVTHYDKKEVIYDISGWTEKNRSKLPGHIIKLFQNSENPLLSLLFRANFINRGDIPSKFGKPLAKERNLPLVSHYKNSIINILKRVDNSTASFVCCINPSSSSSSSSTAPGSNEEDVLYDDAYVRKQFDDMGLKDLVQNFKNIHQVAFTFEEFLERYSSLSDPSTSSPPREACKEILNAQIMSTDWKLDKCKIFMKQCQVDQLNKVLFTGSTSQGPQNRLTPPKKNPPEQQEKIKEGTNALYSKPLPFSQRPGNRIHPKNDELHKPIATKDLKLSSSRSNNSSPSGSRNDGSCRRSTRKTSLVKKIYPLLNLTDQSTVRRRKMAGQKATSQKIGSSSESDFEEWTPIAERRFGESGSRVSSVEWFKSTQAKHLLQNGRFYADWFHGIITRKKAEQLLKDKPLGCFLIRVAESRLGFSLTFKGPKKCYHYLVNELPDYRYQVLGEKGSHESLVDLVEYYKKNKVVDCCRLTTACPQNAGECDYAELVLSVEDIAEVAPRPRVKPPAPFSS